MNQAQFKEAMLYHAVATAKVLAEYIVNQDGIKIEPEQVRKNATTILVILTETEDFLKDFLPCEETHEINNCSNSAI